MKTRIHIHREDIVGTANKKHFMVSIPRDADEIIAIKVSAIKAKKDDGENHFEVGLLRITRDGIVMYETQVRAEAFDAEFIFNPSPSPIEKGIVKQFGAHENFHNVRFSGQPRALFCRFDGNKAPSNTAYVLALYFLYTKKNTKP
jgi:hypothetical protein